MRLPPSILRLLQDVEPAWPADRASRVRASVTALFERASMTLTDGTVFLATGDIPAMWIRDSTWQVRPLLSLPPDAACLRFLGGVSRRQSRNLLIDLRANAFNPTASGRCWHRDAPDQDPLVFERKFELDSLAAFLDLGLRIQRSTGYRDHLDASFWAAAAGVVALCAAEQEHDQSTYRFLRPGAPAHDQLSHDGFGAPCTPNGLVWSGFRPSDDRCELPYLVPANAHLAVTLGWLAEDGACPPALKADAKRIAADITHAVGGIAGDDGVLPYEVDGRGNAIMLDDPNVPSLLALPYLGWCQPADPDYCITRSWVLSSANPNFVDHGGVQGLASEHTPAGWVWPLSIAIRGLTAAEPAERDTCLTILERTDAGTGRQHESFDPADPRSFTRAWFSWADMTYVQLALAQAGLPTV